LKAINF